MRMYLSAIGATETCMSLIQFLPENKNCQFIYKFFMTFSYQLFLMFDVSYRVSSVATNTQFNLFIEFHRLTKQKYCMRHRVLKYGAE